VRAYERRDAAAAARAAALPTRSRSAAGAKVAHVEPAHAEPLHDLVQAAVGHVHPQRKRVAARAFVELDHRAVELAHRCRFQPDGDRLAWHEGPATQFRLELRGVESRDAGMRVALAVEREHAARVDDERAHVENAGL
jgi:hypothetical protein